MIKITITTTEMTEVGHEGQVVTVLTDALLDWLNRRFIAAKEKGQQVRFHVCSDDTPDGEFTVSYQRDFNTD